MFSTPYVCPPVCPSRLITPEPLLYYYISGNHFKFSQNVSYHAGITTQFYFHVIYNRVKCKFWFASKYSRNKLDADFL